MKKSDRKKKTKRILRLPDLDYAKRPVLNSPGSPASKRAYEFGIDDLVAWCRNPGSRSAEQSCCAIGSNRSPADLPRYDKPAFGGVAPACL